MSSAMQIAMQDMGRLIQLANANMDEILALVSKDRNYLINGNFDIWQRGTSISQTANNVSGYSADRWFFQLYSGASGGTNNTVNVTQQSFIAGQTEVPNNPSFFCRYEIASVDPIFSSGAMARMQQRIEDVRTFAGQTVTVSFWMKANAAREIAVVLTQNFGSGGSAMVSVGSKLNIGTAWTKYEVTLTMPSISGKTIGDGNHVRVELVFYKDGDSSISSPSGVVGTWAIGTFNIAQVQVNSGEVALPFQPRSFAEELALCQRYYEKSFPYNFAPADASTLANSQAYRAYSTYAFHSFGTIPFKVKKRISPTVTLYNPMVISTDKIRAFAAGTNHPGIVESAGDSGFQLRVNNSSVNVDDLLLAHWSADAEF